MNKYKHNTHVSVIDKNNPFYLKDGVVIGTPTDSCPLYLIKLEIDRNNRNMYCFSENQLILKKLKSFL